MYTLLRLFMTILALPTGMLLTALPFSSLAPDDHPVIFVARWLVALGLAATMWIVSKDPFATARRAFVFGTLLCGSVGFVFGFFGIAGIALLMGDDPGLAPVWGFLLGPAGFLLGGMAAVELRERRS